MYPPRIKPIFKTLTFETRFGTCWIVARSERRTWLEGTFGCIAPYHCEDCGPCWDQPEEVVTARGTYSQPEEIEWACPRCGCREYADDMGGDPFKVLSRRRVKRTQLAR